MRNVIKELCNKRNCGGLERKDHRNSEVILANTIDFSVLQFSDVRLRVK